MVLPCLLVENTRERGGTEKENVDPKEGKKNTTCKTSHVDVNNQNPLF